MDEKSKLSTEQKQKLKKYAVFALMAIICAGSVWFIFKPSDADIEKEQQGIGFNADIPDPKKDEIIGDKKGAYEQDQMQQRQKDRMQSLQGYADMLENSQKERVSLDLDNEPEQKKLSLSLKHQSITQFPLIRTSIKHWGIFMISPKMIPKKLN